MNHREVNRFAIVAGAGMVLCCTLTTLASAGVLAAVVGSVGGVLGLVLAAAVLAGGLVIARRQARHRHRSCCAEPPASDATARPPVDAIKEP